MDGFSFSGFQKRAAAKNTMDEIKKEEEGADVEEAVEAAPEQEGGEEAAAPDAPAGTE